MTFLVVVPPISEPITLEDARMHLRLTADSNNDSPPVYSHPEDALVRSLISAARDYCEQNLMRSLAPQIVETVLDAFPANEIQLLGSPIVQIISIIYVDSNGASQTMAPFDYVLDNVQEPGWVLPQMSTPWPTALAAANSVRIRYETGYTGVADSPNDRPMPASIRQAMMLLIGHWYENREAINVGNVISTPLDFAVKALLKPYQLRLSLA